MTNEISASSIFDSKYEALMETFESIFHKLENKRYTPTFKITDTQTTTQCKAFLTKEICNWQFVELSNHHVNAVEKLI